MKNSAVNAVVHTQNISVHINTLLRHYFSISAVYEIEYSEFRQVLGIKTTVNIWGLILQPLKGVIFQRPCACLAITTAECNNLNV